MKIVLVHDDFVQLGGAERLFEEIAKIFPKAPIYTSLVNLEKLPESIDKKRIHTSFMQKIPFAKKYYKLFLPLYPFAFESFNFDQFDVVISSTTRFAKSIITKPKTVHICYINSAPRFLYNEKASGNYVPFYMRFFIKPVLLWLKRYDKVASARPDFYIANSKNIAKSIEENYGRESTVIFPFADTNFYNLPKKEEKRGNYFLVVSRLVKWKNIQIAIEACQSLNQRLVIIGTGPDEARLKKFAASNRQLNITRTVEFLPKVSREQLRSFYQNARALIVMQREDFGIASAEAQACGIPVIAYRFGGQAEIIQPGETGILFREQSAQSLKGAIVASSGVKWEKSAIRQNALRFSKENFVKSFEAFVENESGRK